MLEKIIQKSEYPAPQYPGEPLQIPVANGVMFSTGNLAQALFLQFIYPDLRIKTPFTRHEFFELWSKHNHIRHLALNLRNHLYYSEAEREPIQSILSDVYQIITSQQISNTPIDEQDPTAKEIAEKLMTIYFDSLNITLSDVKRVIAESGIQLDELNDEYIRHIKNTAIKKAEHKHPIALFAILPDRDIINIAVEQCRNESSWSNYLIGTMKNIWKKIVKFFSRSNHYPAVNYFLPHPVANKAPHTNAQPNAALSSPQPCEVPKINYMIPFTPLPVLQPMIRRPLVTTKTPLNDDDEQPAPVTRPDPVRLSSPSQPAQTSNSAAHLKHYKVAVIKTLDQYIHNYKFSAFGHHHDSRARAVRLAVQNAPSIQDIYTILKRQEVIFSDVRERLATMSSQELQMFTRIPEHLVWRNFFMNKQRWNGFFDVVNYTQPVKSGYYQIIQEALSLDPYDASIPIRFGLT